MDRIRGGTLSAGVVQKIEWNPRGARLLKGCDGSVLKVLTMNEYETGEEENAYQSNEVYYRCSRSQTARS
jgi:hypothetical protein